MPFGTLVLLNFHIWFFMFWRVLKGNVTRRSFNLFLQATNNYEKAVQLNWNSPQVGLDK